MGLRCLLGHNFGEPEVERDREEDGNEVVITVREVKKCTRCGDQQVVSENKEITSLDQLTDEAALAEEQAAAERDAGATVDSEPGTADATGPTAGETVVADAEGDAGADAGVTVDAADEPAASEPPADGAGAEIIDDGPADGAPSEPEPTVDLSEAAEGGDPTDPAPGAADGQAPPEGGDVEIPEDGDAEIIEETEPAETGVDETADPGTVADEVPGGSEADPETDPAEDDGVILEEEPEEPADRDPGEWPDVEPEQEVAGEHSPWPDQRGEDEGFDATVDDGTDADVSFGGGLQPEAADTGEAVDADEDTEFIETPDETESGFIATAEESASVGGSTESNGTTPNATGGSGGRRGDLGTRSPEGLTEYYCPECGLAEIAGESSMRAGDVCPECKGGYVAERQAE